MQGKDVSLNNNETQTDVSLLSVYFQLTEILLRSPVLQALHVRVYSTNKTGEMFAFNIVDDEIEMEIYQIMLNITCRLSQQAVGTAASRKITEVK